MGSFALERKRSDEIIRPLFQLEFQQTIEDSTGLPTCLPLYSFLRSKLNFPGGSVDEILKYQTIFRMCCYSANLSIFPSISNPQAKRFKPL